MRCAAAAAPEMSFVHSPVLLFIIIPWAVAVGSGHAGKGYRLVRGDVVGPICTATNMNN